MIKCERCGAVLFGRGFPKVWKCPHYWPIILLPNMNGNSNERIVKYKKMYYYLKRCDADLHKFVDIPLDLILKHQYMINDFARAVIFFMEKEIKEFVYPPFERFAFSLHSKLLSVNGKGMRHPSTIIVVPHSSSNKVVKLSFTKTNQRLRSYSVEDGKDSDTDTLVIDCLAILC